MAKGDIVQTASANAYPATSNPVTISAAVAGNLLVCYAFTGAGSITLPSGFSSAVTIRDNSNSDDAEISYKIAAGGETSVAPGSTTSDEHVAIVVEIEGPFDSTPLDVSASNGATSEGTTDTGTTATTAQNDEVYAGAVTLRDGTPNFGTWGDSARSHGVESTDYKSIAACSKVLTTTGTQSTSITHDTNTAMGMIATFKLDVAAPSRRRIDPILFGGGV